MIIITINNNICKLSGDFNRIKKIRNEWRIRHPRQFYLRRYMHEGWDGYVYYVSNTGIVKIGFFPELIRRLEEKEYDYKIIDNREPIKLRDITKLPGILGFRPYQIDGIRSIRDNKVAGIPFHMGVINAATNAGKCTGHDTLLFKEQTGLIRLKDINPSLPKDTAMPIDFKIQTEYGYTHTDNLFHSGEIETLKIITQYGYEIVCGYHNHRLKVLSLEGGLVWKKVRKLRKGDVLPLTYNQRCFGEGYKVCGEILLNEDMAYALGVLHGDGHITKRGFQISAHHLDVEVLYTIANTFEKALGINVLKNIKRKKGNRANQYTLGKKGIKLKQLWEYIPELVVGSFTKRVPRLILQSPRSVQTSYLQGYFDTDGSCGVKGRTRSVSITSVSERGMYEVQQMLLNMGIICSRGIKKTTWKNKGVRKWGITHRLIIRDIFIEKFREEVGFRLGRKATQLNKICKVSRKAIPIFPDRIFSYLHQLHDLGLNEAHNWNRIKSKVPIARFIRRKTVISQDTLNTILMDYQEFSETSPHKALVALNQPNTIWVSIKSITRGQEDCWDIVVPETHSYIGNGFINHNTRMMLGIYKSFKVERAIILLGELDLYRQFLKEIPELLPNVDWGYMQGKTVKWGKLMIVMVKTLSNNLKNYEYKLRDVDMVLTDECDVATSKTYTRVLTFLYNARVRVGLSGSVFMRKLKRDQLRNNMVRAYFGEETFRIKNKELIDMGYSTPVVVKIIMGNNRLLRVGDYNEEYRQGIILNKERNKTCLDRIGMNANEGRIPMLIVSKFHEHVELLHSLINIKFGHKYSVGMVHDEVKNRKEVMEKFRDGEIDILVASKLIKRGKNFPLIKYLLNAGGGDAPEDVIQLLGRLLRTDKSKDKVYMEDFFDAGTHLMRHSKHRILAYKNEKLKVILINFDTI